MMISDSFARQVRMEDPKPQFQNEKARMRRATHGPRQTPQMESV
jgi:hypothetical protein